MLLIFGCLRTSQEDDICGQSKNVRANLHGVVCRVTLKKVWAVQENAEQGQEGCCAEQSWNLQVLPVFQNELNLLLKLACPARKQVVCFVLMVNTIMNGKRDK